MAIVSVVIPVYNRSRELKRAVASVLEQDFRDLEVIIVDDASQEDIGKITRDFNDNRIVYIKHDDNLGPSAARNTAIKAAKGEFIAFLDSDDQWFPGKLKKQVDVFQKEPLNTGVVYSGVFKVCDRRQYYLPTCFYGKKEGDISGDLVKMNFINFSSAIVRRECFEKTGLFDERIWGIEDWDIWLGISRKYHFKFIREPLAIVNMSGGNISRNRIMIYRGVQIIFEKHHELFTTDSNVLAHYYCHVGHLLCLSGDMLAGRKYIFRSIKIRVLDMRQICALFLSLLGCSLYRKMETSWCLAHNRFVRF